MPKAKKRRTTAGVSHYVTVVAPEAGVDQSLDAGRSVRQTMSASSVRGPTAIHAARVAAAERYKQVTMGLSEESQRVLADIRGGDVAGPAEGSADVIMGTADRDDADWEDEPAEDSAESISYAIRDLLEARPAFRKYRDQRTWRQRVRNLDENWRPILPQLVNAYIEWRYGDHPSPESPTPSPYDFEIETLDIYERTASAIIRRSATDTSAAEVLVRQGYLGTVPLQPSLAISLRMLELLRVIRLFKPSFSIEAFTKVVCHIYVVPYRRHLRTSLGDAFDIYLTILRAVRKRVLVHLGRDDPDWRVKNACPACAYKLEGENPAEFSRMVVMDGNNSLKRMAPTGNRKIGDTRVFDDSEYFLPREYVDRFADEVRSRNNPVRPEVPQRANGLSEEADEEAEAVGGPDGDPTDGQEKTSDCTKNWKAAASDDAKRMWKVFEETGIFACACRHGLMLYIVDMLRSGELAKYPIAIVKKLCDVLQEKLLVGYDIGCSFQETVKRSSVGQQFTGLGCRMCVNAFHGYSHAYPCQVQHHPNVIAGVGIEDLETLERIFSASNQLAPVTRYATAYRRRVLIDLFFQQWDEEKYQNIGMMLYNNYVQALDIIETKSVALADAMRSLKVTYEDLRAYEREEKTYFATLQDEEPSNILAIAYVEALQELRTMSEALKSTSTQFYGAAREGVQWTSPETGPVDYAAALSRTRKLETQRRVLRENVQTLRAEVVEMELHLNITTTWQPGDRQYQETLKYIATRKYQKALGKLQRLVIQRLFELHRLNLSQTAYRVRSFVAKNLQTRCQAIRRAVNEYNSAAAQLDPPRSPLDWTQVSHFSFLEEFTLLDNTRNDIRDKPWATPAMRETMRMGRRVVRAQEELDNVQREVRRLHTSIRDEETLFADVLRTLRENKDPLQGAVQEYCQRRRSANAYNLVYIQKLYDLKGFAGDPVPGVHVGAKLPTVQNTASQSPPAQPQDCGMTPADPIAHTDDPAAPQEHAGTTIPDELPTRSIVAHTSPVPPPPENLQSLEELLETEKKAIDRDVADAEDQVDEEDVQDVADLVDHMSNIAVAL